MPDPTQQTTEEHSQGTDQVPAQPTVNPDNPTDIFEGGDVLGSIFGDTAQGAEHSTGDGQPDEQATQPQNQSSEQAGAERETTGPEQSKSTANAEGGLIEVNLGERGKVSVTPDIAEILTAQQRDYKHLQGELTRRTQQPNEQSKPANKPDAQALRQQTAERQADLTKRIMAEIDKDDGGDLGKILQDHTAQTAAAYAQHFATQELQRFVEQQFQPLLELVQDGLGDVIIERRLPGALAELESEIGIGKLDSNKVVAEMNALHRTTGAPKDHNLMVKAALRVAAASRHVMDPAPKKSAKPNQAPYRGALTSTQQSPPSQRTTGVVHHANLMDAL